MADLRHLQRQLDSAGALSDIVAAMRNMAAAYVRRAEAVAMALSVALGRGAGALAELPEDAPGLAVVFASDQGLCGTYNERIVEAALEHGRSAPGRVEFIVVGHRGRDLLSMRGTEPVLALGAPGSLEAIRSRITDVAAEIYRAYGESGAQRLFFVYNEYEGMGRYRETVRRVLPPPGDDLAGAESPFSYEPILTAPPRDVLARLAEEYFFIELCRALLESHASENGARLTSMTSASTNVDNRVADLTKQYQTARQDEITAELLEVVSGAEALTVEGDATRRNSP